MNGKAGAPKGTSEVGAAIEGELRRLASRPGGWEVAVHMLAQAGDPATAYTLACNDWYLLARAFEVLLVRNGQSLSFTSLLSTHGSVNSL
jgi:tRNA dimethylallyltransferase